MLDGTLRRHKNGTVEFPGIDHGGPGKILAENDDYVVIKWPKSTYRGGVPNPRIYNPPSISVYARTVKRAGHRKEKIESMKGLIGWDVTRPKKKEEKENG